MDSFQISGKVGEGRSPKCACCNCDFPYVWDEVVIGVTNESDFSYALRVIKDTTLAIVGESMKAPAEEYKRLIEKALSSFDVAIEPQVFLSADDAWTNITVRYLVPVRERRRRSSDLLLAICTEIEKPEHQGKIRGAYPRTEIAFAKVEEGNFGKTFRQESEEV